MVRRADLKSIAPPGRCRRLDSPNGDNRIVSPCHLINFWRVCNDPSKNGWRQCNGPCRCSFSRLRHSEGPLMGRRMLLAILILIAASGTVVAHAQTTGRVTGTVTVEGRGLPNANVIVLGTDPVVGTMTDANGRYSLGSVPTGAQRVQARLIGYTPIALPVTVTAGQRVALGFFFATQARQLRGMGTGGEGGASRRQGPCGGSSVQSEGN